MPTQTDLSARSPRSEDPSASATEPLGTELSLDRPRSPRSNQVRWVLANTAPLVLLLTWWIAAQNASPAEIPDPIDVADRTWDLMFGSAASQTYVSFARIIVSVMVAMLIGFVLVTVAQLVPVTDRLIGQRILPFVNSVPALGWAILGVIWFGVGNFAVVFVVTLILVPFTLVNLWQGMQSLDRDLREMGHSFSRSRWRVMRRVEIPMLAPYALAATRLSFAVGWKVALIAEFFGAQEGLGLVMNQGRQLLDTPTVFATIVVVVIFVVAVDRLVFDQLAKRLAMKTGTVVATGV